MASPFFMLYVPPVDSSNSNETIWDQSISRTASFHMSLPRHWHYCQRSPPHTQSDIGTVGTWKSDHSMGRSLLCPLPLVFPAQHKMLSAAFRLGKGQTTCYFVWQVGFVFWSWNYHGGVICPFCSSRDGQITCHGNFHLGKWHGSLSKSPLAPTLPSQAQLGSCGL